MISLEKWKILTPLQNLPSNVRILAKLIYAKGFKKLPKVQKFAKSGHTESDANATIQLWVQHHCKAAFYNIIPSLKKNLTKGSSSCLFLFSFLPFSQILEGW